MGLIVEKNNITFYNISSSFVFNQHFDILYVGGDGEGNYTIIQDAINDSSDGDTVFVYDDSSPYYENLILNKKVNLIGEDKNTTVINGNSAGDIVKINWNFVNVSGFTIQNSGDNNRGILLESNNCNIYDNIIFNNGLGIEIRFSQDNNITDNKIVNNKKYGLYIYRSDRNIIKNNIISLNSKDGIILRGSDYNYIMFNKINSNKEIGIYVTAGALATNWTKIPSKYNIIETNNITLNNVSGMYILNSLKNIIIKNNFIENKLDAFCKTPLFYKNKWTQNYWNEPRLLPKIISRKIIISGFGIPPSFVIYIPWFTFDWHPALRIYNI